MKSGNAFSFYHCVPVILSLWATWGRFATVDAADAAAQGAAADNSVNDVAQPCNVDHTIAADTDSDGGKDIDEFGL